MRESGYYPPGAEFDPSAPYNEVVVPERNFEVTISQTLSRPVTITTSDYCPEFDEDDGHTYCNTENTDWKKAYEDCDFKIQDLLLELKDYVIKEMNNTSPLSGRGVYLKQLLEACDGWVEDDYEVVED